MKISFKYEVAKEEIWDYNKNKMVNVITNRYFGFYISYNKSEEEKADNTMNSFQTYIEDNSNYQMQLFGDDGLSDDIIQLTGYIENVDISDKEDIKDLYRIWKKEILPTL